jgi:hypothetical protein
MSGDPTVKRVEPVVAPTPPAGCSPERANTSEEIEDRLDEELLDSFPASDPPSLTQPGDPRPEPDYHI